jgi:hypothetical protein
VRLLIGGTPTGTLKHISAAEYRAHCGMLVSWRDQAHPRRAVKLGAPWAMDNFAYTAFDPVRFRRSLVAYEGVPGCLFTVAPDVWGDAAVTLDQFGVWHDEIKGHGYPIALAVQNGQETRPVPWADLDAVFIGGDTAFKFSDYVRDLVTEARMRGKWVHLGRVNSVRRWNYAHSLHVNSVDGTSLVIARANIRYAMPVVRNKQHSLWEGRWA